MKKSSVTLKTILAATVAVMGAYLPGSAQIVSQVDSGAVVVGVTSVPTINQGPTNTGSTGTDGYQFYSDEQGYDSATNTFPVSNPTSLPSYVSSITIDGGLTGSQGPAITIGSTSYIATGAIDNFQYNGATGDVATIQSSIVAVRFIPYRML
jgi:hypothetical protein